MDTSGPARTWGGMLGPRSSLASILMVTLAACEPELEPDADHDGLSDREEAELGTDPHAKDSDHDNYWDAWELAEGTDPLDYESRIYAGFWPYYPDKDELEQGAWGTGTELGTPFPRASFIDQHGDLVDLYDFANFTVNEPHEPAYIAIDVSAAWCGPCHDVSAWLAGDVDSTTALFQGVYPTVRDKVRGLRVWWITVVVEASGGQRPEPIDAEYWYTRHHDVYVPILVDGDQRIRDEFGIGVYPHVFLLDPELRMAYFPTREDVEAKGFPGIARLDELPWKGGLP
ncbi:hypothetical protein ACNOYE_19495 [Nannocystaceae bacterium ST9]